MYALYVLSVTLHILAVATWLGGMLFLVLVLVPWLHQGGQANVTLFLRETGRRFRTVAWVCFGVLLVTGTFNLWMRGVRLSDFADPQWLSSSFGGLVLLKLGLFSTVLIVSVVHDLIVGPQARAAIERHPRSPETETLRRRASLLGRVDLVLAILLVASGVMLVRGLPW